MSVHPTYSFPPTFPPTYDQVVDGLCSGFILSSIKVFGLAACAAVLMVVMASAAASLAFHHPGDAEPAAEPLVDEDYLPVTYTGASAPKPRPVPVGQAPQPYQATGNYKQYAQAPGAVDW